MPPVAAESADAARVVVHGDPVRLTPIVENLLRNAAKYTDPGGHIVLASVRPGGVLALGRGEALSRGVRGRYDELDARNRIFVRVG